MIIDLFLHRALFPNFYLNPSLFFPRNKSPKNNRSFKKYHFVDNLWVDMQDVLSAIDVCAFSKMKCLSLLLMMQIDAEIV